MSFIFILAIGIVLLIIVFGGGLAAIRQKGQTRADQEFRRDKPDKEQCSLQIPSPLASGQARNLRLPAWS